MWRLGLVGLPIFLAMAQQSGSSESNPGPLLRVFAVLSTVISGQVYLAEYDILIPSSVVRVLWIVGVVLLLPPALWLVARDWRRVGKGMVLSAFVSMGAFLPWFEPLKRHSSVFFGAPFSNSNNDLAIYIVSADNFINAGFREFGRVLGYQAGALANFEVAGSSSMIGLLAKLTGAPVWRVVTLAMLMVLLVTASCIFCIARILNLSLHNSVLVAVFSVIAPWSIKIPQNFFLSQAISRMALAIALLSIAHLFRCETRGAVVTCLVGIWSSVWLSLVTYPSGTVVATLVAGLMTPALLAGPWITCTRAERGVLVRRLLLAGGAVLAVTPFVINRWSLITSNVSLYSRENVTGWEDSTNSLLEFLGLPMKTLGGWTFAFAMLLLVLGLAFGSLRQTHFKLNLLVALLVLMAVLSVYLLVVSRVGLSAYQTWKTLATIQIFIPVVIGLMLEALRPYLRAFGRYGLIAGVLTGAVVWNTHVGGDTYRFSTQLPSMELENAAKDVRLAQENLFVGLRPYLETMIAPVILDLQGAVYASDSYLGPGSIDPNRCTLVRGKRRDDAVQLTPNLQLRPKSVCLAP